MKLAILEKASDIHLEINKNSGRIRYRIDGILYNRKTIDKATHLQLITKIKLLSNMDIGETVLPQDGKIDYKLKDRSIDLRVSSFPTAYGEKLVIRILDKSIHEFDLNNLGFTKIYINEIKKVLSRNKGLFLVTGPSGSGKTTSLYTFMKYLNYNNLNIISIEDPIEYIFDGINQSQIDYKRGFKYENALKSVLRQDPDIIMIGEIRDSNVAKMAIEASYTGHLILSTLHSENAKKSYSRMKNLGIRKDELDEEIVGILSQRLVRKLCPNCKRISSNNYSWFYKKYPEFKGIKLYEPVGCSRCLQGYQGRQVLTELLKYEKDKKCYLDFKFSVLENLKLGNIYIEDVKLYLK